MFSSFHFSADLSPRMVLATATVCFIGSTWKMDIIREGELHPLHNHHILEIIFGHLHAKDLKQCRLVSRQWRMLGTNALRPTTKVKIDETNNLTQFIRLVEGDESNFSVFPFSSAFQIYSVFISGEFTALWGGHITHLDLNCVKFPTANALRNTIFVFCPNLIKLEICSVKVENSASTLMDTDWKDPQFPPNHNVKSLSLYGTLYYLMTSISLVELFVHFTALEELRADCHAAHHKIHNIFRSLDSVRNKDKNLCKIKRLQCNFEYLGNHDILVSSLDKNTALEFLEAKWMRNENDMLAIERICTANSKSLKKLYMIGNRLHDTIIRIPENLKLTKLECFALVAWKLDSFTFMRHFRNIKALILRLDEIRDNSCMDKISLPNCTEVTLMIENETTQLEVLKTFQTMLPNITKLRVFYATNTTFAFICEFWPQLKSLELKDSDVNDSGLRGWDEEDVDYINMKEYDSYWTPVTVPRSNLTNLKGLQNFTYEMKNSLAIPLAYCAAVHGVMLLPELTNLNVPETSGFGRAWDLLRIQLKPKTDFLLLTEDVML